MPEVTAEHSFTEEQIRHDYRFDLESGALLRLELDQHGVDVIVTLRSSDEKVLFKVDSLNEAWGPEELWLIAREAGRYRLVVERPSLAALGGHYRLKSEIRRPEEITRQDRQRTDAFSSRARGANLPFHEALKVYRQAAELWRQSGDAEQEILTWFDIAHLYRSHKNLSQEIDAYEQARNSIRPSIPHKLQLMILHRLGRAQREAGDFENAEANQDAALELAEVYEDIEGQSISYNNLALIRLEQNVPGEALDLYRRAMKVFRQRGRPDLKASTLYSMGRLLSHMGQVSEATEYLEESCEIRRQLGVPDRLAVTLVELAWAHLGQGDSRSTIRFLREAIEILEELDKPEVLAQALDRLGTAYRHLGQFDQALTSYRRSLEITDGLDNGRNAAATLLNLAELDLERGKTRRCKQRVAEVLARLAALRQPDLHAGAHAHYVLSRAEFALGRFDAALDHGEETLAIVEDLREELTVPSLTLAFFASRQLYFDHQIELLMACHRRAPAAGYGRRALETAERSRARVLLDDLVRHSQEQPPVLGHRQIQNLLDEDTRLLVYHLGKVSSTLWFVGPEASAAFSLPPAEEIAEIASSFIRLVRRSDREEARGQYLIEAGEVGRVLLGPVAARLGARRLVIVGPGPLSFLPFAALPDPETGKSLVECHEMVHIRSASALAALRWRSASRSPAPRAVAIFADPVFSTRDPRVQGAPGSPKSASTGEGEYPRLAASRREAEAIAALVPKTGSHLWTGFEARREAVLDTQLQQFRILHFATHGHLHSVHSESSGVVLSRIDQMGREQDGLLHSADVANLEIGADLVVLSACETGLGRKVRGEGVLGLPRAWMQAGATSVVVSLWRVDDEATAVLMESFYRALLEERRSKSAALRAAQLTLARDPLWHSPFYWAGFVLLGDWR